jgi:hypothetical protein
VIDVLLIIGRESDVLEDETEQTCFGAFEDVLPEVDMDGSFWEQ